MSMLLDKSKMFGLLDDPNTGQRIQRQVRILKVGIGVPSGPDIHVWISPVDGQWCIEVGSYAGGKRQGNVTKYADKNDAWKAYVQARKSAPQRSYPRKVPYFTFLRMGADGNYVHDFEAIEQHGATPTEIDIVFLENDPLDAAFQMFTAAELKCEGNGIDARRRLSMAATPEEKELAEIAAANGEKFFPIINGCYTKGCPFPKDGKCKPHGRLTFQLLNSPRIGGTCSYDTTSYRSIPQLSSGIEQIKSVTGRGVAEHGRVAGIPLKLVLRPYKASHDGKTSTQFGVSLEFRAANAVELAKMLIHTADEYHEALQLGTSLPEGAELPDVSGLMEEAESGEAALTPGEEEAIDAAAMEAEFFGTEMPEDNQWEDPVAIENGTAQGTKTATETPRTAMPRRKSEAKPEQGDLLPGGEAPVTAEELEQAGI
jgi:hypothetical protein